MTTLVFLNDGGRAAAGFKGSTGDCVTRAIAIATERPYLEVYEALNMLATSERPRRGKKRSSARTGVFRKTYEKYLLSLGWKWVPTMKIGSGCTVHLKAEELPKGRLIASVSRHLVAVIDGFIHDTDDPGRDGTRCVYGYYLPPFVPTPNDCGSCRGYGHFTEDGEPTIDKRDRTCLDCGGAGEQT